MAVTIRDIAKRANVSVTTVSQIMNDKGSRFTKRTRDRVLQTAKAMNYRPNRLAASLITRQTKTLGVIVPDIRNPFFSALAHGIDERATELGWSIFLSNSSDSHEKDLHLISVMNSLQVDGICFCLAGNTDEQSFLACYQELADADIPFLLVDRYYEIDDMQNVLTLDHEKAGYLATSHLLELGHRRIACITGPLHLVDARMRLVGYERALAEYDVSIDETLIFEGNYRQESGYRHANWILDTMPDVTAFFACNDLMALGVMDAIEQAEKIIPNDFSVVGYDDVVSEYFKRSPLTSIYQPVGDLGRKTADIIIARINGAEATLKVDLTPKLQRRKSTAPLL